MISISFARVLYTVLAGLMVLAQPVLAGQTSVAVAANFTAAAKEIAAAFQQNTGDEAVLSFGASGQFFTQISQGAPFEVFLSADQERPRAATEKGLAVADTRFTYAIGKLVLWSKVPGLTLDARTLRGAVFAKLAFCNPQAAPYGAAAVETMKALQVYETLLPKLVQGENIAQAFQFVETGNAELGFVALSQVADGHSGSSWLVPQELYAPIRQDAVLLKTGAGNPAARSFLVFLKGPQARAIIEKYDYSFENPP